VTFFLSWLIPRCDASLTSGAAYKWFEIIGFSIMCIMNVGFMGSGSDKLVGMIQARLQVNTMFRDRYAVIKISRVNIVFGVLDMTLI